MGQYIVRMGTQQKIWIHDVVVHEAAVFMREPGNRRQPAPAAHRHRLDACPKHHRPAVEAVAYLALASGARHGFADSMELRMHTGAVIALAVVLAHEFPVRRDVVLDALAAHQLTHAETR